MTIETLARQRMPVSRNALFFWAKLLSFLVCYWSLAQIVRKAFLRRRDIDRPAQALTQHHDLGKRNTREGKRREKRKRHAPSQARVASRT